jgi:membrane-bound metal-dependent hydrolase YbcI (DUF457 family)
MFIFGHIGITLATVYLIAYSLDRLLPEKSFRIDYRLVVFGSLLPDMIDKPLGRIVLAETIGSGRIFAHTLLFGILLAFAGYFLFRRTEDSKLLVLAGASFFHLLEDQVWKSPKVFFWPFSGLNFPRDQISGNFFEYLAVVFSHAYNPAYTGVFTSEIIGFCITALFAGSYARTKITGN